MLPPPLPDPPEVRRQSVAVYTMTARTAHLVAPEVVRAFDERDRERLLAAVDALVEVLGQCPSTPRS